MIAHLYGGPRDGAELELPSLPISLQFLRDDMRVIYMETDDEPPPLDVDVITYRRQDPIDGTQATYQYEP